MQQEWKIDLSEPSFQDMAKTKQEARMLLLNHVPEMFNFVGNQNACRGTLKVFDSLQDKQLNKQLFYEMLEKTLCEFAPELRPE